MDNNILDGIVRPSPAMRTASDLVSSISNQIKAFEATLDDEHEAGIYLASHTGALYVERIESFDPNMLVFYGFLNGNRARLVQHVSQLSFLMCALPKPDPEMPPRRIGF